MYLIYIFSKYTKLEIEKTIRRNVQFTHSLWEILETIAIVWVKDEDLWQISKAIKMGLIASGEHKEEEKNLAYLLA